MVHTIVIRNRIAIRLKRWVCSVSLNMLEKLCLALSFSALIAVGRGKGEMEDGDLGD